MARAPATTPTPTGSPTFNVPTTRRRSGTTRSASRPSSLDRRVRLNASVFFMDWEGPAGRGIPVPDARGPVVELRADGQCRRRSEGAEVELLAAATDNFTLGGSIGYLDTEIKDEPPCDAVPASRDRPASRSPAGSTSPRSGSRCPRRRSSRPTRSANTACRHRHERGLAARASTSIATAMYSDIEALTNLQTRGPSPNGLSNPDGPFNLVRVVGDDEFPYKVPSFDVSTCAAGSTGNTRRSPVRGERVRRGVLHRHAGELRAERHPPAAASARPTAPSCFRF